MQLPQQRFSVEEWWRLSLLGRPKDERRHLATMWNLWKERNRRVFDRVLASPPRILALIKDEMKIRDLACGGGELGFQLVT